MEIDDRIQAIKDEWGKAHKGERRWGMLAVILFIAGWAAGQLDFHDASVGLFIGTGGMVLAMLYDGIRSEILRAQFDQALFIAQFVTQELREIRQEIQK